MAMTPPRYGNFRYGDQITIDILIERLQQIATTFLDDSPFSSYMTTQDSQSFYGLEYAEVRELCQEHTGKLKSLSTSSSTQQGKGVSINLYFEKNGIRARGQFVIATGDYSLNEQIEEMIYGIWTPRPEPEPEPEKPVPAPEPVVKPKGKAPVKSPKKPVDSIDISIDKFQQEPIDSEAPIQVSSFRESFFFNRDISPAKLEKLLLKISSQYMNGAPFSVNLTTLDGEPYVDIGISGLKRFIGKKQNQIQVISLDASTSDGELVDIKLLYKEDITGPNAEVDIFSSHTDLIKELILTDLTPEADTSPSHMMVKPIFGVHPFEIKLQQCSVSMPLDAYWSDPLWEELEDILKGANLTAIRAEGLFATNALSHNWKLINESALFIADLTYKQPDVFFKLGIAQTLGKDIIIISQHDRDIPKDFANFPQLLYNNNHEEGLKQLRKDLEAAIEALG